MRGPRQFDYVVVGAGSAGCVLAERLSRDASVLLVEAGSRRPPASSADPGRWAEAIGGPADWGHLTAPQPGLLGRSVGAPHGLMVGGTSSLNAMLYMRGAPSDFDGWADAGAAGWSHADLEPYFRRVEGYAGLDAPHLGVGGPLHLESRGARPHPASVDFLAAAEARGHRRVQGFDGPDGLPGAGYFLANIRGGRRFGTREAYLDPALDRDTLTVWAGNRAVELAFSGDRCVGLTVLGPDGPVAAGAAREVVLSAGAVESPKLLMLSGVGPERKLRELGIQPRRPLPGVGENLHDHVMVVARFDPARDVPEIDYAGDAGVFLGSRPDGAGADLELIFNPTAFDRHDPSRPPAGLTMLTALVRPVARGTLRLASGDPAAHPRLDPNLLGADADVERLVMALRESLALATTAPLAGWIARGSGDGRLSAADGADLRTWVRANAVPQHHLGGSCRMGVDDLAVVDPELRVHGVDGLRVADASVMPTVVAGHCQGAVLAIAERAADLMLDSSAEA